MSAATLREARSAQGKAPPAGAPLRKPHVCFVAPYAWPVLARDPAIPVVGGAEVQQSILARLFAANGYRMSLITLDYGQPSPTTIDGITVHKAFSVAGGIPVLRFVYPRLTTMWRALGEVDADLYYQRSSAMWTGVVAQFCRSHGKRSIYAGASDRDFEPGEEPIQFARDRWLYRWGIAHVDRVIAQNAVQLESCRRNHRREALLIPSCYVPPPHARRATLEHDRVLWVGTTHDHKRPHWFLDIAERLPERRFVMIGGPSIGAERQRPGFFDTVRRRAASLPNVEFTGFLPLEEVERWFDRARLLVLTSLYEGMPNVFLQAWARGIPTVATVDVGAPVNIVFGDVAQGAARVETLLSDSALWTQAANDCLAYFERNHSATEVLARYARLFDELAEK